MSVTTGIAGFFARFARPARSGGGPDPGAFRGGSRARSSLRTFVNASAGGVVGFAPPNPYRAEEYAPFNAPHRGGLKPGVVRDANRFYGGLTIAGKRVFNYLTACGTCGFLFEKLAEPEARLDDEAMVELLSTLETLPDDATLARIAAILPPGEYVPLIVEAVPLLVQRGDPDDYLAGDYLRLFGYEPPDGTELPDPKTRYYRMGPAIAQRCRSGGLSAEARLFSFLAPLHDPATLDRARVDHWRGVAASGRPLTGFAFAGFEAKSPHGSGEGSDPDDDVSVHLELKSFLLDGHHRVQAAAESGVPARVLAMVSRAGSHFGRPGSVEIDVPKVLRRCGRQ